MDFPNQMQRSSSVQFNPDDYPHATLKAFNEFIEQYEYRYEAQYPDPPKHAIENAVASWKVEHEDNNPSAEQNKAIRAAWTSKDMVRKLLGFFASVRLQQDWKAAEPDKDVARTCSWEDFLIKMRAYYKPTENRILRNFEFRQLTQQPRETFNAFCTRVEAEGKNCHFCECTGNDCTAEEYAMRDQIVVGTHNEQIREAAMLKDWDLKTLRSKGMKIESAASGEEKMSHANIINKLGAYSYKNVHKRKDSKKSDKPGSKCYRCGERFSRDHLKKCKGLHAKCTNCHRKGHLEIVCMQKDVSKNDVSHEDSESCSDSEQDTYLLNLWSMKLNSGSRHLSARTRDDFKTWVYANNCLVKLLCDTGAKVSVCGKKQAASWGILDRITPSQAKIRPYNSAPLQVLGTATCAVSKDSITIPVTFFVLPGSCEPILDGNAALQLKIISFHDNEDVFNSINMIDKESPFTSDKNFVREINNIINKYSGNFKGLGKLKNHKVKLYIDENVKPVAVPPRSVPYHLKQRLDDTIDGMIGNDVIEEHPKEEPAPWVSCAVIVPKPDGTIRVTLDARNINKAIQSTNQPIPRQEDIKAQLSGCTVFSKLDLKSSFWQLELDPTSRFLTVFHCNGKLYRYKRLLMGVKPAQSELNAALRPVFAGIPNVYLIHDDLVIAAKTCTEHNTALRQVMEALQSANLTLNPNKCIFGKSRIVFWGMVISDEGVSPDPEKISALENLDPPKSKEELKSFICMMQSNSDFIPFFAKRVSKLRDLLNSPSRFKWSADHQLVFQDLLNAFKKDTLLNYFDLTKKTFVFTDAHKSGLSAILAQGENAESSRPIALVSRATNKAEKNYSQLDLEATAVDFSLRRFRNYLVGSPDVITIVTDHKPLLSVFNGKRLGSVRTERMKMRHQDLFYTLEFRKGEENTADYLSRHAMPWETLPKDIKKEANELVHLLYTLHLSPVLDAIGIRDIAIETKKDPVLRKLTKLIKSGKTYIPKHERELKQFSKIIPEITCLQNGTLVKQDRIILPFTLHEKAIKLAHLGAHPGENGLKRRLRSHFYIVGLNKMVEAVVKSCDLCQSFSNKNTRDPITPNKVPQRCWEETSVDLFGPLPSRNHVVVVQDLASRFPYAKIVKSTKADSVIPVLNEAYDLLGNPDRQKSDNGPPFNSKKMLSFTSDRGIEQIKIPPGHPAANNVETVMKPLGKAMKIGLETRKRSENDILNSFLVNFRDTPHTSTGIAPAAMLFRDGYKTKLPRIQTSDKRVQEARHFDKYSKAKRSAKYNQSRHTKQSCFRAGDNVIVKNYKKQSKFDPNFSLEKFLVIEISADGHKVAVQSTLDQQKVLVRHPNDLKAVSPNPKLTEVYKKTVSMEEIWRDAFQNILTNRHQYDDDSDDNSDADVISPRRSGRERNPPERYASGDIYTH